MSNTQTNRPSCKTHEQAAQVLCKTDLDFVCTQCLIGKEGGPHGAGCELVEISTMKSRADTMLVHLLMLKQMANNKLKDREGIEEYVDNEKQRVAAEIERRSNRLKEKIDKMMGECREDMEVDFNKQLQKTQKEKESLTKVMNTLQTGIDKLVAMGDDMPMNGLEYQSFVQKQRQASTTLSHITDRDHACFGKFELAQNLHEIESGKRRHFGKATLMFRSLPRNNISGNSFRH